MKTSVVDHAQGRWFEILSAIGGIPNHYLDNNHKPCPSCRDGDDRFRFDDLDGNGTWFCSHCGGRDGAGGGGTGMSLLMRVKGWEFKEAARAVEDFLGIPRPSTSKPVAPRPIKPPTDATPPALDGASQQWCYTDAVGQPLFWIQRVNRPNGDKIFRPRTWVAGTGWQGEKGTAWPAPRPLYNLAALHARPTTQVIVCEGEKAADRAQELFPSLVAVAWPNGAQSVAKVDWSPLTGRNILLWPDNDDEGRKAMEKAAALIPSPGKLLTINAPPGAPEKWDIADAEWTPAEALAYVKANHRPMELPQPEPETIAIPEPEPTPEPIKPSAGGYFTCLGFDADGYYYQPRSTGQVVRLSRSSHTGTNLVAIAPLAYYETLYPGKQGINWTWAAASLFEQQAAAGVYSPDRIRGRGAWWDQGRTVLHMGDRLVVDGDAIPITRSFKSAYLYQRSAALTGPGNASPLTDEEALAICELAERFHWEVPASGLLLAGWVTLAPICGALRWRPHIWLTASAGSGKSAILDRYVSPLLSDMGLHVAGNTSEAGLRQTLRADALPVVFDEAESNEKADQTRMQSILALARVASSESHAHMLKGSPGGDVTRFTIRSMFMMSSIATALKQGADRSRFAQLTLRNPTELPKAERTAHWEALDRDLERCIGPDAAKRLLARTMALIPTIRASVAVFTRVAAERFDSQRLGDQYGTLLAGAWSLMSSEPVTTEQARALIDQNNWEPYSQTTEVPDEERCIQHILQHQVRVETDHGTHTRTLGELVGISSKGEMSFDIPSNIAEGTLGRYGLKVEGDALLISNTAQAIASILRDTAWGHSWGTLLARLPGATKPGVVRFKGLGATSRAVRIPLDTL
jgi:putative DNA primase/helicase